MSVINHWYIDGLVFIQVAAFQQTCTSHGDYACSHSFQTVIFSEMSFKILFKVVTLERRPLLRILMSLKLKASNLGFSS